MQLNELKWKYTKLMKVLLAYVRRKIRQQGRIKLYKYIKHFEIKNIHFKWKCIQD